MKRFFPMLSQFSKLSMTPEYWAGKNLYVLSSQLISTFEQSEKHYLGNPTRIRTQYATPSGLHTVHLQGVSDFVRSTAEVGITPFFILDDPSFIFQAKNRSKFLNERDLESLMTKAIGSQNPKDIFEYLKNTFILTPEDIRVHREFLKLMGLTLITPTSHPSELQAVLANNDPNGRVFSVSNEMFARKCNSLVQFELGPGTNLVVKEFERLRKTNKLTDDQIVEALVIIQCMDQPGFEGLTMALVDSLINDTTNPKVSLANQTKSVLHIMKFKELMSFLTRIRSMKPSKFEVTESKAITDTAEFAKGLTALIPDLQIEVQSRLVENFKRIVKARAQYPLRKMVPLSKDLLKEDEEEDWDAIAAEAEAKPQ